MKSIRTCIAVGSALMLAVVCGAAATRPDAIEKIMDTGFKKGGLRQQIGTEVGKDKPDWAAVVKKSKDFQALCEQLAKQTPPKGDAESWRTLTQTILAEAKTISDGAATKDQAKTKAAVKKINSSCKTCHDAHRE